MKVIQLVYHERLGDIIRLFHAAHQLAQEYDQVYIECEEKFHSIFECVDYVKPLVAGHRVECIPGSFDAEYSHTVMQLQIHPNYMEQYRMSGQSWEDFIYGRIKQSFPKVGPYKAPYLKWTSVEGYENFLPKMKYNLVAPFGVSQHIKIDPIEVIAKAKQMYGENIPLYVLSDKPVKGIDNILIAPKTSMLPEIIEKAENFLGINSAPIIIASGVRKSYDYIKITGDAAMDQDNYVHPKGRAIEWKKKQSVSLFIKSYQGDFDWLPYCLKSIAKFGRGFNETVLMFDSEDEHIVKNWGLTKEKVCYEPLNGRNGYMVQQVRKLHADQYCDSEFIAMLDSDTIFSSEFDAQKELFRDGKPIMYYTPYSDLAGDQSVVWQKITTDFMMMHEDYEFMRCLPLIYPKILFHEFRSYCLNTHGKTIEEYILACPDRSFSEFNAFGSFCWKFYRERFTWISTREEVSKMPILQSWSWARLKQEDVEKFNRILG